MSSALHTMNGRVLECILGAYEYTASTLKYHARLTRLFVPYLSKAVE